MLIARCAKTNLHYLVLRDQESFNITINREISLVKIAKRKHLFPYRTQQLSSSAPMVVNARVGLCQAKKLASIAQLVRAHDC